MSRQKEYARRLRKELENILKDPPPNIQALPNPDNILEWHYVITGPESSLYEGGMYHGKIKFPDEYPHKPPRYRNMCILMFTPSGRFKPNTRLCFSMSDFHPETWNPMWSVSSILTGLLSFMLSDENNYGSISSSADEKRKLAKYSMEFNKKNPVFCKMFPKLAGLASEDEEEEEAPASSPSTVASPAQATSAPASPEAAALPKPAAADKPAPAATAAPMGVNAAAGRQRGGAAKSTVPVGVVLAVVIAVVGYFVLHKL